MVNTFNRPIHLAHIRTAIKLIKLLSRERMFAFLNHRNVQQLATFI